MQKFLLIFRQNFYLLLAGLLAFIPLYPKIPLFGISGTFVAVRLEDILIFLVFLLWFLINLNKIKIFLGERIFQVFTLFFLIGLLSVISGVFVTFSTTPELGFIHWIRRIEYMGLFLISASSISSQKQVKLIFFTFLSVAMIVVLYGFGQIYLNFPVISTTNSEFSKGLILYLAKGARVNSTFAGHYDLAVYLSIVLTLLASFFLYFRHLLGKLLITIQGLLSFILLAFTAGRISFVASIFGIAFVFWLNKNKILILGLFLLAIFSIFAIPELRHRLVATITVNIIGGGGPKYSPPPGTITPFTPIEQIPESERERILNEREQGISSNPTEGTTISADTVAGEPVNSTELGVYRSFGIRLNVEWPRAINAFYKNPLLGSGYASITLATDNDILRSLGETGLLGTVALVLVFFAVLKKMNRFIERANGFDKYFVIGIFSSTVVVLITGTFIDVLEASKIAEVFWLLLGVTWAVCSDYKTTNDT